MERRPPMPMTPFDTLVTSSDLQMMKIMLPYVPASYQRLLAFYIKFIELQNTIQYFGSSGRKFDRTDNTPPSPADILNDIRPYMDSKDSGTFDTVLSAMSMMEMMNGMDMEGLSGMGDLSGMMDMMNMFGGSNRNDNQESNDKKGNDSDERMDEQSGNEEYGSPEAGTD